MSYSQKLKDPRWQKKRLEIFNRDEFTCRDCGAKDKTLHVHHCHYDRREPWEMAEALLLTLCDQCHESRGSLESDAKLMLAQIMAQLPHEPGNQEDLQSFVESLRGTVEGIGVDPDGYSPTVMSEHDVDFISDARWFSYACDHPDGRKMYETVTYYKPNWRGLDADRERREMNRWLAAG